MQNSQVTQLLLTKSFNPKKQRLLFHIDHKQICANLNMTSGCLFTENANEVKMLIEDATTRKLREIKLVK